MLGPTVYEMYVTEEINVPMSGVVNNECNVTGFFPLETIKYVESSPNNYHTYIFSGRK